MPKKTILFRYQYFFLFFLFFSNYLVSAQELPVEEEPFLEKNQRIIDGESVQAIQYSQLRGLELEKSYDNFSDDEKKSLGFYTFIDGDVRQGKELLISNIQKFLKKYPVSVNTEPAKLEQLLLLCYLGDLKKATNAEKSIQISLLSKKEQRLYHYLQGFLAIEKGDIKRAQKYFSLIDSTTQDYIYYNSIYYEALYYFDSQKYEDALKQFLTLYAILEYKTLAPYFITESLYKLEKKDSLLMLGQEFLEIRDVENRKSIFYRIVQTSFENKKYEKVFDYHEKYADTTFDNTYYQYMVGRSYFEKKEYDNAIEMFFFVTNSKQQQVSKIAYYYIGTSYLKKGKRTLARASFKECLKQEPTTDSISEYCYFTDVKLAFEDVANPFANSIKYTQSFLDKFPNSEYSSFAFELLAKNYLQSSDYENAIKSIENISGFSTKPKISSKYRDITFYRGVEQYLSGEYDLALKNLNKSNSILPRTEKYISACYLLAEIYYKKEDYFAALGELGEITSKTQYLKEEEYPKALSLSGYSHLQLKDKESAYEQFYQLSTIDREGVSEEAFKTIKDALIRLGDISYSRRQFQEATLFYKKNQEIDENPKEYVLYNLAKAYGLSGQHEKKIETLSLLTSTFSDSPSRPEYKNEIAETYIRLENYQKAFGVYEEILGEEKSPIYYPIALLQRANMKYNLGKLEESLSFYTIVLESEVEKKYKKVAFTNCKTIYTELANIEEYEKFINTYSDNSFDSAQQDSAFYQLALYQYLDQKWKKSTLAFERYLQKFPDGLNSEAAFYYKGVSELKRKNEKDAIASFEQVIQKGKGTFYERALEKIVLYYSESTTDTISLHQYSLLLLQNTENPENKRNALYHYLTTSFSLGKTNDFLEEIKKHTLSIFSDAQHYELLLKKGKALNKTNKTKEAVKVFSKLVMMTKTVYGAEAKYLIAFHYHNVGEYSLSSKKIFELNEEFYAHEYWVVKGFILLGDNYVGEDNIFQAKHTYQSIIDNYNGTDLLKVVQQKLDALPSK